MLRTFNYWISEEESVEDKEKSNFEICVKEQIYKVVIKRTYK